MINYVYFKKGDKLEISWDQLNKKDISMLKSFPKKRKGLSVKRSWDGSFGIQK